MDINREATLTTVQNGLQMSDEFIALLRQRIAAQFYDQPEVIDLIARAILHSRGLYP